jgi:catechol 1,2-dioxygenase
MSQQRTAQVVGELFTAIREVLTKHHVSYEEYNAAKEYLIAVGQAGEWPLFAALVGESTVERVAARANAGSESTIEGPYYVPGAPALQRPYVLPQRENEPGDVLIFNATVSTPTGEPISGAVLDMWQADATGGYSHINPSLPGYNLRGKLTTDEHGAIELQTVVPAPYEIPNDGPVGQLLRAAGWHAWRPAHLHFIITAAGYQPLTTQLYFDNDPWLGSDCAGAVKPELVLHLDKHEDPGVLARRALRVPYYSASYAFRLGCS